MSQYAVGIIAEKLIASIPSIGAWAATAVAEDVLEALITADVIEMPA